MQTVKQATGNPVPATGSAIDPSKIFVRAMKGFLYSPVTKRLYDIINRMEVGPSTYERPWSVQPRYGFEQPVYPLNPVDYPTAETANKVLEWARAQWPTSGIIFDIFAPAPTGGVVTQLQYWLIAWNGQDLYEIFSAGWTAFDYDKDGQQAAYEQFTAQLRAAGFSV